MVCGFCEEQNQGAEMDLELDRYKLFEYQCDGVVNKYISETLDDVLERLQGRLKQIRAENMLSKGAFVPTYNKFTKEVLIKRYRIEVTFPHTIFIIKRLTKGSIDIEWFMEIIKGMVE